MAEARYAVRHETYGRIGEITRRFRCEGERLVVESATEVRVKFLLFTAYRRTGRQHEVWDGDRLIDFASEVTEDGEVFRTRARREGERLLIEGVEGALEAPPDTVSNDPWNDVILARELIFGARTGKLFKVRSEALGEEPLTIDGEPVPATRYRMTGDDPRDLWYDANGRLLQSRIERDGGAVTITLE
jgi:hypothetical protein